MKTTMKLFAALTIMLGFSVTTFGQQVGAAAKVLSAIDVTTGNDLQFGNVTRNNHKTVGTGTPVVVQGIAGGATETAGSFTVGKGANSQVTLTFTLPTNLSTGGTSPDLLAIDYLTVGANVLGAIIVGGTPATFVPSNGLVLPVSSTNYSAAFGSDEFLVRIGGTVKPLALQPAGDYTGTIIMTAAYN